MKKWREILNVKGDVLVCPYCLKVIPPKEISIDHKIPLSRGGKTVKENLVVCCKKCNQEKGSLTVEEYLEWKKLNFLRNGNFNRQK